MDLSQRIRSRGRRIITFIRLSNEQREYVRLIKDKAGLDRRHYAAAHRWIHAIERRFPERHYVVRGEALGLSPSADFAPHVYQHLNPTVSVDGAPLRHYLTVGRGAGLAAREPALRSVAGPGQLSVGSRYAVVAHVHYFELWPELVRYFQQSGLDADLYVTTTASSARAGDQAVSALEEQLGKVLPNRLISKVPNRGRDIGSFVYLVNSGVLENYDAVCKVHTKRSPGRDGDQWRRDLLDSLLPPEAGLLAEAFCRDEDALVTSADRWIRSGSSAWGLNKGEVMRLLRDDGAEVGDDVAPYPAGSMYWIKQPVLAQIQALGLTYDDFMEEMGWVDGTTAHAFERLLGYLSRRAGGEVVATSALASRRLRA